MTSTKPRLGLALGGGAALGLAHIGVLRVLLDNGIVPDVVAGTSIGAIVGAAHLFGKLDELEAAARGVTWLEVMRLSDVRIGNRGLLAGDAVVKEVQRYIGEATFDDADRPFAVVASDLASGEEVVINAGSVAHAIRASISLPGIFPPVEREGRFLIDGGMTNPVPVSTCHALGADRVIAVDVTGDYSGQAAAAGIYPGGDFKGGLFEVVTLSWAMAMRRLAAANQTTHPAEVTIVPRVGHIKQFEFGQGEELIAAGRDAALACLPDLQALAAP